jgi:hypothetical protein
VGFVSVTRYNRLAAREGSRLRADFARPFLLRNARLRAWSSRLPVEGSWRVDEGGWAELTLRCAACRRDERRLRSPHGGEDAPPDDASLSAALIEAEARAAGALLEGGCGHLAPLLEEDPVEIRELTALELLAGDP